MLINAFMTTQRVKYLNLVAVKSYKSKRYKLFCILFGNGMNNETTLFLLDSINNFKEFVTLHYVG